MLVVMAVLLLGTVVTVVPSLQGRTDAVSPELASAPPSPLIRSGLVEIARTDDAEYIVEDGDTLSTIARAHHIDYQTLAAYNDIGAPYTIVAGERIVIPGTLSLGAEQQ